MTPDGSRFPFPLPNGWFRVGFADECAAGSIRPLRFFGRELALAVTESGTPQLFDAHCPHLGAHIGYGGGVEGESVRCPFHAWRFALDGECVEIPYARRIPAGVRLRAWPTQLRGGVIFAWHHAAGAPPSWQPPELPEIAGANPDWTPLLHHRWRIRTRNQEIAENTSDPAHFMAVHGFPAVPAPEIAFEQHRCRSVSHYDAPKAGGGTVASSIDVSWHGLGIGVTRSRGSLELLFLGTTTPIDDSEVETCFSFSVCRARGFDPEHGLGKAAIDEAIRQMQQDIPIWENKCFRAAPVLCDGDGPIARFRGWAGQFYSGSSSEP